jgi:hypothetical protein
MAKRRPNRLKTLQKVLAGLGQLAPLVTALTGAAVAGHSIGWW